MVIRVYRLTTTIKSAAVNQTIITLKVIQIILDQNNIKNS